MLLVWLFNIEGTLDLIAATFMGPAYWVPAFLDWCWRCSATECAPVVT